MNENQIYEPQNLDSNAAPLPQMGWCPKCFARLGTTRLCNTCLMAGKRHVQKLEDW